MGPKASSANQTNEYTALLKDYQIVKQIDTEGLFFLKNVNNGGDFILREFTFNDKKQFQRYVEILQKRKNQLSGCKYVVPLQKIVTKSEDQYCSTFYKIFALFQFTQRTLEDQINQRNVQKRKFQEKELWSILASCIVGLSHLQKNSIKHQALRSNSILISQEGVIKVYDPITTGCQSNYDLLITKRSTPHIYLSPQMADSLQLQAGQPHSHAYKSDIWTMGMIVLQAGLLQYQDQCYRDECSRVHWDTIQYNIHRFRQSYSEELAALVEFMLSKQEKNRPDWLELEERVIKEEESRVSQANISRESNVFRPAERVQSTFRAQPQAPFQTRFTSQRAHLVTSNAIPIYQDPAYRAAHSIGPQKISNQVRPPLLDSNARSISQPSGIQFKPSNIENSRPLRNVFPSNNYETLTKVDENLIVVTEDDRFSDVEDTPNSRNHISYFDSTARQEGTHNITGFQPQPQMFNTTPAQNTIKIPPNFSPYGNAAFQHKTQFQPPLVPLVQTVPPVSTPPPQPLSQSAPEGGEYVVERYKQGSEYKGYKWEDMRHGFGIFYYQDGGMYEGQWRFNRMQGKGKLYYQSGKLAYQGDWVNDQFEGFGKLYNEYPEMSNQPLDYRNLDEIQQMWTKYEGQFSQDLKNGKGVLFLTNGEYYEGEFRDDYADGQGVYTKMNGEKIRGQWNKNILAS